MASRTLHRFEGCISGGAFASGDAVVVGTWRRSPLGRLVDAMWRTPEGERVLLAPTRAAGAYIAGLYAFDRVEAVDVRGGWDGGAVAVAAGPLRVRLVAGPRDWRSWLFAARPRRLLHAPRWVALEDTVARPVVGRLLGGAAGVRAAGTAPGGQREWYGVADWRPVVAGALTVDGRECGSLQSLPADLGVGLSSFPGAPAVVAVTTTIEPLASAEVASRPGGDRGERRGERRVASRRPAIGRGDGPWRGARR